MVNVAVEPPAIQFLQISPDTLRNVPRCRKLAQNLKAKPDRGLWGWTSWCLSPRCTPFVGVKATFLNDDQSGRKNAMSRCNGAEFETAKLLSVFLGHNTYCPS